jgi:hypothetical protein
MTREKILNATNAFIESIKKEESTVQKVVVFTYEEFYEYTESIMEKSYEVCKSTVSLMRKSEMGGEIPAEDFWVIRQVFLNEAEKPVEIPKKKGAFFGRIVYAKSVDPKFIEFMNTKKIKTFKINRN